MVSMGKYIINCNEFPTNCCPNCDSCVLLEKVLQAGAPLQQQWAREWRWEKGRGLVWKSVAWISFPVVLGRNATAVTVGNRIIHNTTHGSYTGQVCVLRYWSTCMLYPIPLFWLESTAFWNTFTSFPKALLRKIHSFP